MKNTLKGILRKPTRSADSKFDRFDVKQKSVQFFPQTYVYEFEKEDQEYLSSSSDDDYE